MPFPSPTLFPDSAVFPGADEGPAVDITVTARIVGQWSFEVETLDFVELQVRVNGVVTTDYQVAVVPDPQRPVTWSAPATLAGKVGLLVGSYLPDLYEVFVKVTSPSEAPVASAGVLFVRGVA